MLITLWQTVLKGSLAALAILLAGYATEYLLNQPENPFLLASMGASAVILFALPQSPMALRYGYWIAALNDIGVVMTDMSESGLENLHRLASGHAHRRREKQPDPANIRQPPS